MLTTRATRLLGIEAPVVLAGMASASNVALVAAVSEAGGLGILGGSRLAPDRLRNAVRDLRAATARPFGVNLLLAPTGAGLATPAEAHAALDPIRAALGLPPAPLAPPAASYTPEEQVEVLLAEQVPVLSFGLGDPAPFSESAHRVGSLVMAMVTTVAEARQVEAGGADLVIAQGAEAGGHRSTFPLGPGDAPALVGTMALVPQVVDAVGVPVVAAGGIADGRGVAAALALGADAVAMGTRFLVARESPAFPGWKARLLQATETDTAVTRSFSGRPARVLVNGLLRRLDALGYRPAGWGPQRAITEDIFSAAVGRDDPEHAPLYAGQALRLLEGDQPAAEIVSEVVEAAERVLARLAPRGPA